MFSLGPAMNVFLLVIACVSAVYGALPKAQPVLQLPSYVGKGCSRNDPKINECVVRVGAPAIKQVAQGDPKYRIPKLDPLLIKELRIQQGTKQVGLSLLCKNCLIHGLENTKFERAQVDWDKRTCVWYLSLDKMRINGKYNVSGQVLLLPIVGDGNMEMELSNLKFQYNYDWTYEKRDNGLEYVVIGNSTFPFDVSGMTISLENLFNGDKLLGGNMNRFLNENWRDILKDLKPALSKSLATLTKSILQSMSNVVPFDVMFPKQHPLPAPLSSLETRLNPPETRVQIDLTWWVNESRITSLVFSCTAPSLIFIRTELDCDLMRFTCHIDSISSLVFERVFGIPSLQTADVSSSEDFSGSVYYLRRVVRIWTSPYMKTLNISRLYMH